MTLTASSKCPVCGVDTPHRHTFRELTMKHRLPAIRQAFQEKFKWAATPMGEAFQCSYGIALTMFHMRPDDTYVHDGVELMWRAYLAGALAGHLPLDLRDETPTMQEALAIAKPA